MFSLLESENMGEITATDKSDADDLSASSDVQAMTEQALCQVANERAADTERLGHLHPDVFDALVASGVLRGWVCKEVGGQGSSVTDVLKTIETVSRSDGATGWCIMIANTTALTSHRMPHKWSEEIFADPASCTGGYGMPAGTATLVEGGLEVTGRWSWGSGTDHCTMIGGGVRVIDQDGKPALTRDGAFAPFVFFDPADVELLDTWQVAGLKGTASTDYTVNRVHVPEGRWAQLIGATPTVEGPLGRFPFFGALGSGVSAVTIGLAQRAIDELVLLGEKKSIGSSRSLAERGSVQSDLSMARANVAQARSYLHHCADTLWCQAEEGHEVSDSQRAELRLAATSAAVRCVEAVDLCFHAAGGAAIFETNPLQRVFRDAHVAISHGMIAPRTLEPLGRMAFGLETNAALF